MTIEEKLVQKYGITTNPVLGVWMLRDGRLVNGSYEGHQRDVDHREVSYYYKRSVRASPGSSSIYIQKFMNRGNIRWGCSEFGFCLEYTKTPNSAQFHNIVRYLHEAEQAGIETLITHKTNKYRNYTYRLPLRDWLRHLATSTSNLRELAKEALAKYYYEFYFA